MMSALNIVRCPKCGDPSPWHREQCQLKWTEGAREAEATFTSPDEAVAAAHRILAESPAQDVTLYDLDGVELTITCVGCGRTLTDPATGSVRFCCEEHVRLKAELEG